MYRLKVSVSIRILKLISTQEHPKNLNHNQKFNRVKLQSRNTDLTVNLKTPWVQSRKVHKIGRKITNLLIVLVKTLFSLIILQNLILMK